VLLSTPNRYRRSLEKLAAEPPATLTALIWALLPDIQSALASGKRTKQVWQCLSEEGLAISYDTFRKIIRRLRNKRPIAAAPGGKSVPPSWAAKDAASDVKHDPLANLRRVEASRPGFHFRASQNLDVLVHGRRKSREQSKE
jgi:hypothetical protein